MVSSVQPLPYSFFRPVDILGESGEVILALNWTNFRGCLLVDLFVLQVGKGLLGDLLSNACRLETLRLTDKGALSAILLTFGRKSMYQTYIYLIYVGIYKKRMLPDIRAVEKALKYPILAVGGTGPDPEQLR